jgi:hypothetical protein
MLSELLVVAVATCSWNNPGANPYSKVAPEKALASYAMPIETKEELARKMRAKEYDDVAVIRRDTIEGIDSYTNLRGMHFGNQVCGKVNRKQWKDHQQEVGMVYCHKSSCVIVPTVCNNVSLVDRVKRLGAEKLTVPLYGEKIPSQETHLAYSSHPEFATEEIGFEAPKNKLFRNPVPENTSSFSSGVPVWIDPYTPRGTVGPSIQTPLPVIPEVEALYLMLLGIVVVFFWKTTKDNKSLKSILDRKKVAASVKILLSIYLVGVIGGYFLMKFFTAGAFPWEGL